MHRFIINAPDGIDVDHKNANGLDNRKQNIRLCTVSQNLRNRRKFNNRTSKYLGVCWDKSKGKWMAYIKINCQHKFIGYYNNEEEAAIARDIYTINQFDNFSKLNLLESNNG
jgi:hypothetical protein